ncbi:MAG: hypothetical protein IPN96_23925 [Anaerolineales bacterium]|nr:hypothetical protein [Anaerolineales bacterium]
MKQAIKIFSLTLLLLLMVTPAFALVPFTDVPVGFPAGWVDTGKFNAVWGADANNVYAVGYGNNGENAPLIMYSDGTTWFDDSPLALPGGYTSGQLSNVWGSGTSDIYAVGLGYDTNGQQPLLYHNNGTAWSVQTLPLPGSWTYVQYNAVWGTSASDVYIGGYAYNAPDQILLLFHWNGTNWTDVSPALPGFVYTGQIESIWGSSATDIFAAGWGQDFDGVT